MYRRLRYILVLLYFALMFSYDGTNAYLLVTRARLVTSSRTGWGFTARSDRLYISHLEREGLAAGLRVGDEIVALNGYPENDPVELFKFFEGLKTDSSYDVTVARDGDRETYTLHTVSTPLYWWADLDDSDPAFKAVALQELADQGNSDDQLKLAEAWESTPRWVHLHAFRQRSDRCH